MIAANGLWLPIEEILDDRLVVVRKLCSVIHIGRRVVSLQRRKKNVTKVKPSFLKGRGCNASAKMFREMTVLAEVQAVDETQSKGAIA